MSGRCAIAILAVFAGAPHFGFAFGVEWNGKPLQVHPARVSAYPINQVWPGYQRPVEQTKVDAFVTFDMTSPGELKIAPDELECSGEPIVLPLSFRPEIHRSGRILWVSVDKPRQFTVQFGEKGRVLHVFANKQFVAPEGCGVRRFGRGEHHVGVIEPKSGETIVIDEGAVVYGAIFVAHAHDVKICGRGIVDGSMMERASTNLPVHRAALKAGIPSGFYGADMAVTTFTCAWSTNVTVEGVTFRDPPRWTMICRAESKNVLIDNVKIIGCWRYNSDGINVCASEDVTIRNSFVRSYDDCLIARGRYLSGSRGPTRNVLAENCVLWCDWGKNLEVWAGPYPCLIENVTYRDLAVIRTSCIVADVTTWFASSDTRIRNVLMENVEVDYPYPVMSQYFQRSREDAIYKGTPMTRLPLIIVSSERYGRYLGNQHCEAATDLSSFRVRYENLAFRNFKVLGNPPSTVVSVDATTAPHTVDGLEIVNMPPGTKVSVKGKVTNL